jgi:stage V sporulation protein B
MLSAVAAKLLGALFKIPLTNMLGGVGMSYFSCAYSLFMPVYALTVTGLSSAVARMTAGSAAFGMYENARKIRRTALLIFSAAGLVGSVALAVAARPFCIYIMHVPEASCSVLMIAPSVLFGCITAVERGYYEGLSNMYPTALSQLAEGIVKAAAGLWMCSFVTNNPEIVMKYFPDGTDIRSAAAAAGILGVTLSSVGAAVFFIFVRIFDRKRVPSGDKTLISGREISRELVTIALPTGISAVVTNLTALIDMAALIGCLTVFGCGEKVPEGIAAEEMPHFVYGSFAGIALTVFNLVPSVTNMLGKGILPSVTEAWTERNSEKLRSRTMQALLTASVIAVPSACGMGALSGEILHFLFPNQYDEVEICVTALRYLMPGMVCLCLSFPLFSMLQAIGKPSAPLKIMLVGTLVKLAGNLLLIPFMGADGAAVSTSVCYAVILLLAMRIFLRETGISLELKPFAAVGYAGAMCGAAAYLMSSLAGEGTLSLAASVAVGGAVYFAVIFVLKEMLGQHRKMTA